MTEQTKLSNKITARMDERGNIILTDHLDTAKAITVTFALDTVEAVNLLQFLSDHRDELWQLTQHGEQAEQP